MNCLVVGGKGALGRQLLDDVPGAVGTGRGDDSGGLRLDITDGDLTEAVIRKVAPRVVVNTAAMTSVDGCERDPEAARAVHVDGTRNLVRACEAAGSALVHLSTNYVFDGTDGPYAEDDPPNPLNVYGRTKLESEGIVLDAACRGIVVRTAVFYGPERDRPNFVTWALRELLLGRTIRIVTDEWANPTWLPDLSSAIAALAADDEATGLMHVAGSDYLSRYEMVLEVCEVFGLDRNLVTPVRGEDLGQAAERPLRAGLRVDRIREYLDRSFAPFRSHLETLKGTLGDPESWARRGAKTG